MVATVLSVVEGGEGDEDETDFAVAPVEVRDREELLTRSPKLILALMLRSPFLGEVRVMVVPDL